MAGPIHHQRFGEFLDAVAARTPAPGGGAVAGAAGAIAAALAEMVIAYSIGKKDLAQHEPALKEARGRLMRARALMTQLGDEDALAYALVNELQRLPADDERRMKELPGALRTSVQVPMSVLAAAADVLALLEEFNGRTNRHLDSDWRIAAILSDAAAQAASCNVDVNLSFMPESDFKADARRQQEGMLGRCAEHLGAVLAHRKA